uniref:Uncharacterized protein n=1 Tax=Schizaphis graminum TaxID=13262 RepID=A0A2S2NBC8_SCHGA
MMVGRYGCFVIAKSRKTALLINSIFIHVVNCDRYLNWNTHYIALLVLYRHTVYTEKDNTDTQTVVTIFRRRRTSFRLHNNIITCIKANTIILLAECAIEAAAGAKPKKKITFLPNRVSQSDHVCAAAKICCGGAAAESRCNNTVWRELELDLVVVVVVVRQPAAALGVDGGRPNRPPGGAPAQARQRRVTTAAGESLPGRRTARALLFERVCVCVCVCTCLRRDSSVYLYVCVYII